MVTQPCSVPGAIAIVSMRKEQAVVKADALTIVNRILRTRVVWRRSSLFRRTVPDVRDASPPSIGLTSPHGDTFGMNRSEGAAGFRNRVTAPIERVGQVPAGRHSGFDSHPLDTEARCREGRGHVFLDSCPPDDRCLIGWEHDAVIGHRVDTRLEVA